MNHGDSPGDSDGNHWSLPQSCPLELIVHMGIQQCQHRHPSEGSDSDSTSSERTWSLGDLEFMRGSVPDRTGMMGKHEWSQISWCFDDNQGYFDPYKALDPPRGLGRSKPKGIGMGLAFMEVRPEEWLKPPKKDVGGDDNPLYRPGQYGLRKYLADYIAASELSAILTQVRVPSWDGQLAHSPPWMHPFLRCIDCRGKYFTSDFLLCSLLAAMPEKVNYSRGMWEDRAYASKLDFYDLSAIICHVATRMPVQMRP